MSENNNQSEFFGEKASFLSSIVVLLAAFNSVWDLKFDINLWMVLIECVIVFALMWLILCKPWFDKKLSAKNAKNFSLAMTIGSIIIFVLGLLVQLNPRDYFMVAIYILMILEITAGSIYLLLSKK